ncbi:hypothetical protein ACWDO0_27965 [Nocardia rhamnosiphila]
MAETTIIELTGIWGDHLRISRLDSGDIRIRITGKRPDNWSIDANFTDADAFWIAAALADRPRPSSPRIHHHRAPTPQLREQFPEHARAVELREAVVNAEAASNNPDLVYMDREVKPEGEFPELAARVEEAERAFVAHLRTHRPVLEPTGLWAFEYAAIDTPDEEAPE